MLSRGKTPIFERPDGKWKRCACGNEFPCEYNGRGQMTSRALCTPCREQRARRKADDDPEVPADALRCTDCSALVGLHFGSSVTHLDSDNRCLSCAEWYRKRQTREGWERRGYRLVGGILFRGPAGTPISRAVVPVWPQASPSPSESTPAPGIGSQSLSDDPPYWAEGLPAILSAHGVREADVIGASRRADVVAARAEVAAYLRAQGWTFERIGRRLGGRDNATALSLLRLWDHAHVRDSGYRYAGSEAPGHAKDLLREMVAS